MEQRIDPNTQPGYAAGTDPAFIPGLTAPVTARTPDTSLEQPDLEETEPEQAEQEKPEQDRPEHDRPESEATQERSADDAAPGGEASHGEASDDGDSDEAAGGKDAAADGEEAADGPSFEVSDRRGSIAADRAGVRFRLDDQEADFRWDEIGAVEVKLPRFGRRFTVTVHMSTRRWFNAEVEAPARSSLKEWAAELDTVLDAYFEES
ncbi:hypothetical protein OG887_31505 [Streptomyces sp. NBC_00053]|uniref:hypothetical protein n=1 Tax=unclassified Streptomyces TaxID=2593676 RepID=UPI000F5BCEB4|nr:MULTISPECIES: hypothetical protein [unclassified Streptomyces]WSX04635.1 hypothetical protein OG355_31740 [Streptomyces sp. NBC_00987]MCX4393091.1 hypothetical protein [Streptomyces sp. NBC_01767]MCX5503863.1 hypothetical protein [Streptomyces sp. NBC_00052]MCX5547601.1 hypothetical protein [Streptomyces sp. NBC_00051]RPK63822.1 hypothetical protein EES42_27950 [Streptomyces sp. ADI95-17]